MLMILQTYFWAIWFILILAGIALRIGFVLMRILFRAIRILAIKVLGRNKEYEVKYYG